MVCSGDESSKGVTHARLAPGHRRRAEVRAAQLAGPWPSVYARPDDCVHRRMTTSDSSTMFRGGSRNTTYPQHHVSRCRTVHP